MTAREDFRAAVRSAATYRSSDLGGPGTAGYLLAETQFDAIFEAGEAYRHDQRQPAPGATEATALIDALNEAAQASRSGLLLCDVTAIMDAAVEYGSVRERKVLLSLAADLEAEALTMRRDLSKSALRHAAQLAQNRAESHHTDAERAGPVSVDPGSVSVDSGAADDCLEAGPQ